MAGVSLSHPLVLLTVGLYLYYRPLSKGQKISDLPQPGKFAGHIEDLFKLGKQWFEDPEFFLKKY